MNKTDFDQWLDTLENESCDIPENFELNLKKRINDAIKQPQTDVNPVIPEIDVDLILENFNPEQNKKRSMDNSINRTNKYKQFMHKAKKLKVAGIILLCLAGLSISGVTYAALSGRLSGVFKATDGLEEQLNHPNPVQQIDTCPPTEFTKDPGRFDASQILSAASFENPDLFNSATDIALSNSGNSIYTTEEFIYDIYDIAVFTKENGSGWHLNANESLQITIAIDTTFAASETKGEDMNLAYIKDGRLIIFDLQTITDMPGTFTFIAPEDGDYYLAIINASLSYLKVTTLKIQ